MGISEADPELSWTKTTSDGLGRTIKVEHSHGYTEEYSYTPAGLAATKAVKWRQYAEENVTATYAYDNEGRRTGMTYPTWYYSGSSTTPMAGRSLSYGTDAMGRPYSMTVDSTLRVDAVSYNPTGQVVSMWRSWDLSGSANGFTETRQYNERGQLTRQTLPGEVDIEYRFSATANDGRLWQRKDWVSGEEVTYQYDQLGRLIDAATTGPEWGLSFGFDGFGNLTQQTVTKGTGPSMSMAVDQSTNRLLGSGISYDANGNLLSNSVTAFTYDRKNRVKTAGGDTYAYSWKNERVLVTKADGTKEVHFYGIGGELLGVYRAEWDAAQSKWVAVRVAEKERVYFAGRLLYLGGEKVITDRLGSVVRHGTASYRYYPYGQEIGGATANDKPKFGTYTRDAVSGLDYAMNRYYYSSWGRFTSPDPYQASGGVGDPGSWNRYAYVGGDPVNRNDPRGLFACPVGWGEYEEWVECLSVTFIIPSFAAHDMNEYAAYMQSGGAVLEYTKKLIEDATLQASDRIVTPDCAGLFLAPDANTPENRKAISAKLQGVLGDGLIRAISEENAGSVDANVPGWTTDTFGLIYFVAGRSFTTGTYQGKHLGETSAWRGLSTPEIRQSMVIHEFMHWMGIIGPDSGNYSNREYTLPNGTRVRGSIQVSEEVRKKCF